MAMPGGEPQAEASRAEASRAAALREVRTTYALDHLPAENEVLAIAERWRPYRSLATAYLFSAAFD